MSVITYYKHEIGKREWRWGWLRDGTYTDYNQSNSKTIVTYEVSEAIWVELEYEYCSGLNWARTGNHRIPENPMTISQWNAKQKVKREAEKLERRARSRWHRFLVWLGIREAIPAAKLLTDGK